MHLELIIRVYFIFTSIAAKALIRIKLGRAGPGPRTLTWPLAVTELVLCSQKPFVTVTDLTSVSVYEKSLVEKGDYRQKHHFSI